MNKLYLLFISGVMVSMAYGSQRNQDPNTELAVLLYNQRGNHVVLPVTSQQGRTQLPFVTSQRPITSGGVGSTSQVVKRPSSRMGEGRNSQQSCPKIASTSNSEAVERFAKVGSQMLGGSSQAKRTTALKDFTQDFNDTSNVQSTMPLLGSRAGRNISSRQNDTFLDQERVASVPRTLQKRKLQNISQGANTGGQEQVTSLPCGNKALLNKQETERAQKFALIESKKEGRVDTKKPLTLDEWLRYLGAITDKNEDVVHAQREYDKSFASVKKTINTLKNQVGHLVHVNPLSLSEQENANIIRLKAMEEHLEETKFVLTLNLTDFRRERLKEALSKKELHVNTSDLKKHKEGTWMHNFVLMALMHNDEKNK